MHIYMCMQQESAQKARVEAFAKEITKFPTVPTIINATYVRML